MARQGPARAARRHEGRSSRRRLCGQLLLVRSLHLLPGQLRHRRGHHRRVQLRIGQRGSPLRRLRLHRLTHHPPGGHGARLGGRGVASQGHLLGGAALLLRGDHRPLVPRLHEQAGRGLCRRFHQVPRHGPHRGARHRHQVRGDARQFQLRQRLGGVQDAPRGVLLPRRAVLPLPGNWQLCPHDRRGQADDRLVRPLRVGRGGLAGRRGVRRRKPLPERRHGRRRQLRRLLLQRHGRRRHVRFFGGGLHLQGLVGHDHDRRRADNRREGHRRGRDASRRHQGPQGRDGAGRRGGVRARRDGQPADRLRRGAGLPRGSPRGWSASCSGPSTPRASATPRGSRGNPPC